MPKKTKYKIKMKDGTEKEVEGEIVNKIWGIDKREMVRGEQTMKDGSVRQLKDTHYHISHVPTGAALPLCTFRTMKAAKMLLNEPEFFFDELDSKAISGMSTAIARFWNRVWWKD